MKEKAVEISHLYKYYGKQPALEDVNLEIYKGEVFGLLGPNGAGKTTLLRILAEGLKYEKGEVKLYCKQVGYCPQENIFYNELTVKENLEYFAALTGLERSKVKQRVNELLEKFGLKAYENEEAKKLSGGMQRRLNLAIAVVHDPELLVLDEPTTGLDPLSRREIWRLVRMLRQEGRAIILATHYMEEAETLCDRVCFIYRRILDIGTPQELKEKYKIYSLIKIELKDKPKTLPEGFELDEQGYLIYKTLHPEKDLLEVISRALSMQASIAAIYIETASLEEVFVKLVGEKVCQQ
ncbi:MAG: ABC transporter ATP-binding protein [bacterium]|nr:ABC transporter ATP-binding protein [bacterium]